MKLIDILYWEIYNLAIKLDFLRKNTRKATTVTVTIIAILITLNLSMIFSDNIDSAIGYFICFTVAIILSVVYEYAGRHKIVMQMKATQIHFYFVLFYIVLSIFLVVLR